jgi:L-fuculose-phosphate aldolase
MSQSLESQVATAVRLLYHEGLIDFNGHVSARVDDHILINPRQISRATVQAEHIITVDLFGKVVEGKSEPPSETPLHTAIYRARQDVKSIAHLHSHYITVLGIARQPIVPVFVMGCFFASGVPIYDHADLITTDEKANAVAATLGAANAAVLRGHGAVVVGASVAEAFTTAAYLEENARKQYAASLIGPPQILSEDELRDLRKSIDKTKSVTKVWDYYASRENEKADSSHRQ